MRFIRAMLLVAFHMVKAGLSTLAFPFGFLWGCISIGFGAGMETAERTDYVRKREP